MSQKSAVYCICRSKDSTGFMIGCEKCEEWYHGRCIGIKRKAAENIDKYFCDLCIKSDSSLKIIYKQEPEPQPERKPIPIKQEPLEERKQEKKVFEKNVPISAKVKTKKANQNQQAKVSQNKRKVTHKTKSKEKRIQCYNPECIYEAKAASKYCSPDCGYETNKQVYETHFVPKWQELEKKHSEARLRKMRDLDKLEKDKSSVEDLLRSLRSEKEQTEETIKIIKNQARELQKKENENPGKENTDEDAEMANDDPTGDVSKTFCVTCGGPILVENQFKHWSMCHKKHEDLYNFTSDVEITYNRLCEGDENPNLYCLQQDKKTKRYCMNYRLACPQHTNWQSDKDDVCGCPLTVMEKLVPDGKYCLELKRDCNLHYHWDRFRLAQLDMQRVQAYSRLESLNIQIINARKSLDDTYGGVLGVMLHNTVDHIPEQEDHNNVSPEEQEEVDVDMAGV